MKNLIPLTAIAALVASGISSAQDSTPAYSKPSGYVTQNLEQGFNLIGLTLGPAAETSGTLTAVGATSVTDNGSDFSTNLTAGALYTIEITSGTVSGLVVEVGSWSGDILNTMDDLAASGVIVGDTYRLTKSPTLEEIFGTAASVLKKSNNSSLADILWVPNGSGSYIRYYQNNSGAWRNAAGGAAPNTPLVFLDGIFLEKKDSGTVLLVMTGQVRVDSTIVTLGEGFNLVGTIFATGSTIQSSGLDATLKRSNNSSLADIVWIPTAPGVYTRYYVNNGGTWRNAAGGAAPADLPITSAVFIERKDAGIIQVLLTPPAFYSSL